MSYETNSQAKGGSFTRRLQILSALALSLSAFVGSAAAAIIFICGMKSMDGAHGAQNEGPVIMVLFVVAPALAWNLWASLRPPGDGYGIYVSYGLKYGIVAGGAVYFIAATIAGISMGAVEWGSSLIQLQVYSLVTASAAVLLAGFGGLNFFATKRAGDLD